MNAKTHPVRSSTPKYSRVQNRVRTSEGRHEPREKASNEFGDEPNDTAHSRDEDRETERDTDRKPDVFDSVLGDSPCVSYRTLVKDLFGAFLGDRIPVETPRHEQDATTNAIVEGLPAGDFGVTVRPASSRMSQYAASSALSWSNVRAARTLRRSLVRYTESRASS